MMICQVLAVPPPSIRPSVKHDAQQRSEDDISHIIVNIIKANNPLSDKIKQNATSKVIDDWTTVLQYYCATMIDNRIPGVASVAQRSGRALKSIKERLVGNPNTHANENFDAHFKEEGINGLNRWKRLNIHGMTSPSSEDLTQLIGAV